MQPLLPDQDREDCAQYVYPIGRVQDTRHQCTVHVKIEQRADIYWIIVVDCAFDQPDRLQLTFWRPRDRLSLRLTDSIARRRRAHCRNRRRCRRDRRWFPTSTHGFERFLKWIDRRWLRDICVWLLLDNYWSLLKAGQFRFGFRGGEK